jgi:CspA family cold shock protein
MNIKSTLAVLGPAVVLALVAQPLKLTELSPVSLQILVVALLASVSTVLIRNFRLPPRAASTGAAVKATSKAGSNKESGSVKWFNAGKGFGFITRNNGEEIFVHFRSIVGQRALRDGQRVEFSVTTGSKGLQAEDVVALK